MISVDYNQLISEGFFAFAYDGCHKIYLLKTNDEKEQCEGLGYDVYSLDGLEQAYRDSCPLKFINDWDLSQEQLVPQSVEEDRVVFINFPEVD